MLPYGGKKVLEGIMKKFAVLFVALMVVIVSANASNTLTLSGSVQEKLQVVFKDAPTENTKTTTLEFNGSGDSVSSAIPLTITSNRKVWHIDFVSTNGWKLNNGASDIPYTFDIATPSISSATLAVTTTGSTKKLAATGDGRTTKIGADFNITATVAAQDGDKLYETTTAAYVDTITITIAIN